MLPVRYRSPPAGDADNPKRRPRVSSWRAIQQRHTAQNSGRDDQRTRIKHDSGIGRRVTESAPFPDAMARGSGGFAAAPGLRTRLRKPDDGRASPAADGPGREIAAAIGADAFQRVLGRGAEGAFRYRCGRRRVRRQSCRAFAIGAQFEHGRIVHRVRRTRWRQNPPSGGRGGDCARAREAVYSQAF